MTSQRAAQFLAEVVIEGRVRRSAAVAVAAAGLVGTWTVAGEEQPPGEAEEPGQADLGGGAEGGRRGAKIPRTTRAARLDAFCVSSSLADQLLRFLPGHSRFETPPRVRQCSF